MTDLLSEPVGGPPHGTRPSATYAPLFATWPPNPAQLRNEAAALVAQVAHNLTTSQHPDQLRQAARHLNAAASLLQDADTFDNIDKIHVPQPTPEQTAGQRIRDLRQALGITTQDLANLTGSAVGTIRDIEAGRKPYRARVITMISTVNRPGSTGGSVLTRRLSYVRTQEV